MNLCTKIPMAIKQITAISSDVAKDYATVHDTVDHKKLRIQPSLVHLMKACGGLKAIWKIENKFSLNKSE